MPIYEYRCQSCNEVIEAFVRGGKEPTACTECGAETLTRLISRAGVIFKGSGFYVNDSKGSAKSTSGTSSSSDSDSSSASDSGKSTSDKKDATPAAPAKSESPSQKSDSSSSSGDK